MGYYTEYRIKYNDYGMGEDYAAALKAINPYEFEDFPDDLDLEDMMSWDSFKWYSHDEDMIALSAKFPDEIFTLDGCGEDNGDIWRAYYHNGKSQHTIGKIVFDEYDPFYFQ